ncbi:hypothetical protein C8J56DRAFT_1050619 [Mycena floridula]|nr:hypothetical protein C8J56DRAFT_1050619 [Mycena floridula]
MLLFARWRAFFNRLERLHHLNVKKPEHLWVLHVLFMEQINDDTANFQSTWNSHPISGEGHDKSPNEMQFLGQARFGRYHDDCDNIHPETIRKYYAVEGRRARRGGNETEQEERMMKTQIKHEAVKVPRHANPFINSPEHENAFFKTLAEVIETEVVPAGYGILPTEWDEEGYPDTVTLAVGRRNKPIVLSLADPIWKARAEYWVQGLSVLGCFDV